MIKYSKLICMALVIVIVAATSMPSNATISEEKKKLEEMESKKEDVQSALDDLESSKKDAKDYINTVDKKISGLSLEIYKTEQKLKEIRADIEKTQKKLEEAEKSIEEQYGSMKLRIRYMYENGDTQMLDLILSSENIGDFLNKAEYISEISQYDRTMLDKMQATQQKIEKAQNKLKKSKDNITALQQQQKDDKSNLEVLSDAKQAELKKYDNLIKEGNKSKDSLHSQIGDQQEVIDEMERIEKARAAAAAAAAKQAQNGLSNNNNNRPITKPTASGYTWPLPGYPTISSHFGYRADPFTGETKYHSGIDMPAPAGTTITAAASGQVAWANFSSTAGNWVGIDHGNGVYTVYMHCSALLVTTGQNVSKGQSIGLVGSTGASTGNHLHFSVRVNGGYVNPLNYVSP